MSTCAIVGVNWGDEGKGRMVDLIASNYDIVVRYQGDKISISLDNDGKLREIYKGDILPGGGSIGFDCKRNEVDFRKVEVVELDRNPLPYGEPKSSN